MSNIEIATREIRHAQFVFQPGDKFTPGNMDERTLAALRRQRQIIPLTPENYANNIARRPLGTIGAGFTEAELIERGILSRPVEEAVKERKQTEAVLEGTTPFLSYFIKAEKKGPFVFFSVLDAQGELLRPSAFKKREAAEQFLRELSTQAVG